MSDTDSEGIASDTETFKLSGNVQLTAERKLILPNHGFLEQFEHLSSDSFAALEKIVEAGLTVSERVMLMKVAIKLFAYTCHEAKEEEFTDEQKSEIESLVLELETALHLSF